MNVTTFIQGVELRRGALWHEPLQPIQLQIVTRCESTNPISFTSAACVDNVEICRTQPLPTKDGAARAARKMLTERVVSALKREE